MRLCHNFSWTLTLLINKCLSSFTVNIYVTYIVHNKSFVVVLLLKRTFCERNCFYTQHPSCRFVEYLRYFVKYRYEQYHLSTMGNSYTPQMQIQIHAGTTTCMHIASTTCLTCHEQQQNCRTTNESNRK